jgi:hypothetical protein
MCAACVAQGAAYLVPAYAVVRTRTWQRRRRSSGAPTPAPDATVEDPQPMETVDA